MVLRKVLVVLTASFLLFAACAEEDPAGSNNDASGSEGEETVSCDVAAPPVMTDGVLTVGTERPAFPPLFEG
jgi:PBP1b-binding outer membrane lipoprotein LpoB